MTDPRHGLVSPEFLGREERVEVEALAALCREQDGIRLPLFLDSDGGEPVWGCLYYERGRLVGFMYLVPVDPVEVSGMVDPEFRRRGVGRTLLQAVRAELRLRAVWRVLLVCEEASPSAGAFAQAMGACYHAAEHCMQLAAPPNVPSGRKPFRLRQAGGADAGTLVSITAAAFDDPEDEVHERIGCWLESAAQRFYLGSLDAEPVGSLRVFLIPAEATVYINSFGVLPEHRRRGYGRQILATTADALLAEGWRHILLEVATDNTTALSLYRSCGFEVISSYHYYELPI